MTEEYVTLAKRGRAELTIERSRFLSFCAPTDGAQQAALFVEDVRKRYPDATHVCYAYVADRLGNELKFSDAGEPQGTAGMPILDVLVKQGIRQTAVAVVRYFGGIKLGAGGLVRAYSAAAAAAVRDAGTAVCTLAALLSVKLDYPTYSRCEAALAGLPAVMQSVDYGAEVSLELTVRARDAAAVTKRLQDMTNGKIQIGERERKFYPFPSEVSQ